MGLSGVSTWVASILGVIVLSILVDLILPEGKTSGFIKSIFGYLIIIVIITPIFSFITKKDFNIENIFKTQDVEIQEDFVSNIHRQILDAIEEDIEKQCKAIGILGVEVGISADIFSSDVAIKQINVNVQNLVLQGNFQHTNIKTEIIEIVQKNILVDKEQIIFYE